MLSEILKNHVKEFKDLPKIKEYYSNQKMIKQNKKQIDNKYNVLNTINELTNHFNEDIIFYGGVLVYPEIYGCEKHLRLPSDDVDCVLLESGLNKLNDYSHELFYIEKFDVGFSFHNKIPVTFSYEHIHDWNISDDFFQTKRKVNNSNFCSPEYLITLKLRRNYQRINNNQKIMGKDYVDLVSLFASNTIIDNNEIINLIKTHVTNKDSEILDLIKPLKKYEKQNKNSKEKINKFFKNL